MRLQTVPARQGATWVRMGFRAFARRPIAYAALFTTVLLLIVGVRLLPLLMFVVLPLMPLVSLGFMIATRTVMAGGFPTPRAFIEPLRVDRPRMTAMIQLGIVYAVATCLIMWLGDLVDSGTPEAVMDVPAPGASGADAAEATPGALAGLLLRFALAGLLAVPFWHAPALVYWDGHGCAKALFSSTVACWRNRGAFAVYSLTWLGVVMGLSLVCGLLLAALGQSGMLMSASVPMSLFIATVYYASLYFTFADCFISSDAPPASEPLEVS